MVRFVVVAGLLSSFGCAVNSLDASDAEAEAADAQSHQVEAAASLIGLYQSPSSSHQDGDLAALQLAAAGANPLNPADLDYVRLRCYLRGCALAIAETDKYDIFVSTQGRTYVRFWSVTVDLDGNNQRALTPKLADVYEITPTVTGIALRKTGTSRWQALSTSTGEARCTATGGTWAKDGCTCSGNQPDKAPTVTFVPGAGGCIANPDDNETNCDNSGGLWTDDDATLTGTYCMCGIDRYDDAKGSCASI